MIREILESLEGRNITLTVNDRQESGALWMQENIVVLSPNSRGVRPIIFDIAGIDSLQLNLELPTGLGKNSLRLTLSYTNPMED